jgi:signal transduction histidine kinase
VPGRRIQTGRLRRRLTVAFVLVAGLSAGALALGSFLLVRQARLTESLDRARDEARFDILQARGLPVSGDFEGLFVGFRARGVEVVLVAGGQRFPSDPAVNPQIPADLEQLVARGNLAYRRVSDGERHLLLVGARAPGSAVAVYLVASEDRLFGDLAQLRNVLVVGWLTVLMIAALVGTVLARRTLEPVARASQAARAMAEGLLETRLPVEGKDEFGRWAMSFNEMAEALESKIIALSEAQARERRFTSDVAHELRTPLTALVGEASLLREHLDRMPEDARRPAEMVIHDVSRLRRLVDDLMEISRFDAGRESVVNEPVDLTLLVAATVRARAWEGRVDVRGQRLVIDSDRRRLERIVANLIGNALDHGRRTVRVGVGRKEGDALVEVSDDEPGIDPQHLPHLFDRFYKADPARTGPGSGLGLAIAMENARLLGGDIEVWSEPGLGSRFTLRLPVGELLHGGEERVTKQLQHEAHSPDKGGTK